MSILGIKKFNKSKIYKYPFLNLKIKVMKNNQIFKKIILIKFKI